ncbi:AcrR family transcriptional regulator [Crossiella equi]|uniref:AcrR family transcriptional regulator n=1 Tax=Crossiella equi TaxID=130796 RepID=A0ABS5ADM8_9PSEU|nr:TetR/AcrR family transcriptional regulator [Crossiella equi]MBP2474690.1 AcrR family transcriptional regulator [Crossiella equi]
MPRPKTHDDALRGKLLDRAGHLLSSQGPGALGLRGLAQDVGTSTTAVYSLFGGKPGLLRELHLEAFRRFGAHLAAVPMSEDPAHDLNELGLAYREAALADPHLYAVLFGPMDLGFTPDEETTSAAEAALHPLTEVVRRGLADGVFKAESAEQLANSAWGIVHGLVSLELGGRLLPGDRVADYLRALESHTNGWRATP